MAEADENGSRILVGAPARGESPVDLLKVIGELDLTSWPAEALAPRFLILPASHFGG